jgi:hypothetical protein
VDHLVEHIHGNWPGEIPEVHRWPYDYSNPEHEEDFVPQNVPMKPGESVLHHYCIETSTIVGFFMINSNFDV